MLGAAAGAAAGASSASESGIAGGGGGVCEEGGAAGAAGAAREEEEDAVSPSAGSRGATAHFRETRPRDEAPQELQQTVSSTIRDSRDVFRDVFWGLQRVKCECGGDCRACSGPIAKSPRPVNRKETS